MGESMKPYDTQAHLNEFEQWLIKNNIYQEKFKPLPL